MAKNRKWSDYKYKFFKSFAGGVPDWSSQAAQDYGLEKFGARNTFSATGDVVGREGQDTLHSSPNTDYKKVSVFEKKMLYPRTTKLWGVYWFHHVRLSVRPSVCLSVRL